MTKLVATTGGAWAEFSDFDRTNLRNAARPFANGRGKTIRLVERLGLAMGKVTSLFGTSAAQLFGKCHIPRHDQPQWETILSAVRAHARIGLVCLGDLAKWRL
jgi:hypothetical protein